MKQIKIINGIYGYHVSENVVEPKTVSDAAFFVSDEEAARLVELKVAKYIDEAEITEVAPVQQPEDTEADSKDTAIEADDASQPEPDTLTYSESMKLDDLKKVAIEAGASKAKVKKMRTKKEVISAIEAAVEKASAKQDKAPDIDAADFV